MDSIGNDWGECVVDGIPTLQCIFVVFNNLIQAAVGLGGVVAMFFIVIAGYKYITSQGDPEALQSAKMTAFYAIIGLIFVVFAYFLVEFIGDALGVSLLSPPEDSGV